MDQYINYHKKPYVKYLNTKAFNVKYGTSIPEVKNYDDYFHKVFTAARKAQGPDDFLQVNFSTQDNFADMRNMKCGKKSKHSEMKKLTSELPGDEANNEVEKTPEVNDLDDLLSEEENIIEDEYDEESQVNKEMSATSAPVKNIVTEKKQISDIVLKSSKDSEEFSQDMKHLIQFKSSNLPLESQLMKGRPKYLKALKSYLKGNKDAEVKMSWRKGKTKMVKVADLKPKRDSLKALLRSTPGSLRVVECV